MLQYQIVNNDLKWSHMFGLLEDNKESLGIADYTLSQTSLEQVSFDLFDEGQSSVC